MSIGIIGGLGRMGQRMSSVICQHGFKSIIGIRSNPTDNVSVNDHNMTNDLSYLITNSKTIIISVKPDDIPLVCEQVGLLLNNQSNTKNDKLVLTVAAGIPRESYARWFNSTVYEYNFARIMPSYFINQSGSILGINHSTKIYHSHKKHIYSLFKPGYMIHCHDDQEVDRIMVAAACSPALLAKVYQTFIQAYVNIGLSQKMAHNITKTTLMSLISDSSLNNPQQLIDTVASPGGATAEGLNVFAQHDLTHIVETSVKRTYDRCKQIRQNLHSKVTDSNISEN